MKKLVILFLLVLAFAMPATGEPMSYFDYTDDVLEDGRPIYYFPELSLTLPAQWRGKVVVLVEEGGTSFYQEASYEKYREEGYENGGFLFRISASVNTSFRDLPAFEYLGFSEESAMNYFLVLPTDYPAYNEDAIRREYDTMFAQIKEVAGSASFYADQTAQAGGATDADPTENSQGADLSPAQARYQFEHRMMPRYFYDRPEAVLDGIREVGLYWLWESVCTENGIDPTYSATDYKEHWYTCSDGTLIAQIELPRPDADTLCWRIYFVYNPENKTAGYFTAEYDSFLGESAFLCGWTREFTHENYGGAFIPDQSEGDNQEQLFAEAKQVAEIAGVSTTLQEGEDTAPDNGPEDTTGSSQELMLIPCPELGFTVMADPSFSWDYQEGTGISIYTEHEGTIPYVIIWQDEDLIAQPLDYIKEQFTPHMQKQYGKDLVSYVEYELYDIGGKQLPAGLYTYRLQGYLIDMLRLYDSTGARTVAYTAKYIQNEGDATLAALDTAVRTFQAEEAPEVGQGKDVLVLPETENTVRVPDEAEVNPDYVPPTILTFGNYEYWVNEDQETITISDYIGDEEMVQVPSQIDGYKVTQIGQEAFSYKEMRSLSLPESIDTIGLRAFEYCTIADELALPENVTVRKDAFSYARLPEVLKIPAGATVEKCAFSYCDTIRQVLVGEGAVIKDRAFGYCDNLETVVRGEGSQVEEGAFEYCAKLE